MKLSNIKSNMYIIFPLLNSLFHEIVKCIIKHVYYTSSLEFFIYEKFDALKASKEF